MTGCCPRELMCSARCRVRSRPAWWPIRCGEAMWDKVVNAGQLERLRRARDLLVVTGYDTPQTRLTCYSRAGLDSELADRAAVDPLVRLVGLEELCG